DRLPPPGPPTRSDGPPPGRADRLARRGDSPVRGAAGRPLGHGTDRRTVPRLGGSRPGPGPPRHRSDTSHGGRPPHTERRTMSQPSLEISSLQVGLASLLILINGGISLLLRLGLGRRLVLAALCTVAQLLLLGQVLGWIFRVRRWEVVLGLMAVMTAVAGV